MKQIWLYMTDIKVFNHHQYFLFILFILVAYGAPLTMRSDAVTNEIHDDGTTLNISRVIGPWEGNTSKPCNQMPSDQYRKSYCGNTMSRDCFISTMGFPIPIRPHLYIEPGPGYQINFFIWNLISKSTDLMKWHFFKNCINYIHQNVLFVFIITKMSLTMNSC